MLVNNFQVGLCVNVIKTIILYRYCVYLMTMYILGIILKEFDVIFHQGMVGPGRGLGYVQGGLLFSIDKYVYEGLQLYTLLEVCLCPKSPQPLPKYVLMYIVMSSHHDQC